MRHSWMNHLRQYKRTEFLSVWPLVFILQWHVMTANWPRLSSLVGRQLEQWQTDMPLLLASLFTGTGPRHAWSPAGVTEKLANISILCTGSHQAQCLFWKQFLWTQRARAPPYVKEHAPVLKEEMEFTQTVCTKNGLVPDNKILSSTNKIRARWPWKDIEEHKLNAYY